MKSSVTTLIPHRRARALGVMLAAALTVAGCSSDDPDSDGGSGSGSTGGSEAGTITVLAAASLTDTFTELGEMFEEENDGVTVQLSFGGSSTLVEQIQSGAPADVFASANEKNMDKLDDEAVDPVPFVSNTLEIAVPPGNPAGVASFQDLAEPDLKLVICAAEVPCGTATEKVAQATGVELSPVSEEQSVTDVLGKVSSGEADAGVVYKTDVVGAGDSVEGVEFDESTEAVNTYPIAQLTEAENPGLAQKFIEFVLSDAGQQVFADAGFGKP
ncbi:MAG: molybdate ABC transporter substrate-binding protein [Cumulibacter sp.]